MEMWFGLPNKHTTTYANQSINHQPIHHVYDACDPFVIITPIFYIIADSSEHQTSWTSHHALGACDPSGGPSALPECHGSYGTWCLRVSDRKPPLLNGPTKPRWRNHPKYRTSTLEKNLESVHFIFCFPSTIFVWGAYTSSKCLVGYFLLQQPDDAFLAISGRQCA